MIFLTSLRKLETHLGTQYVDSKSQTFQPWPHLPVSVYSRNLHICFSSKYLVLGRFREEQSSNLGHWKVLDSQCCRPDSAIYQYGVTVWLAAVLALQGPTLYSPQNTYLPKANCVFWKRPQSRMELRAWKNYPSKGWKPACQWWVKVSAPWKKNGWMGL